MISMRSATSSSIVMSDARPQVDVIVPVRGAGPVFRRCASSLARHVDPDRHRVVIVLDGPPDPDATRAVEELRDARLDSAVLEHREPRGFVASVNRGVGHSARDVVLLNSDTQVTSRWLEKLGAAAYADPGTATVTPFSNNATICSLPRFLAENTIPSGYDLESFAALVERRAAREYPRIPTGVGACLYIKRRVLTEVGAFSDTFGLGYGEEIDFCCERPRADTTTSSTMRRSSFMKGAGASGRAGSGECNARTG